jgi:hypothetical protein
MLVNKEEGNSRTYAPVYSVRRVLNLDPTIIHQDPAIPAERPLWTAVLRQAVSAHSSSAKKFWNRSRLVAGAIFSLVRVRIQVGPPFIIPARAKNTRRYFSEVRETPSRQRPVLSSEAEGGTAQEENFGNLNASNSPFSAPQRWSTKHKKILSRFDVICVIRSSYHHLRG